MNQIVDTLIAAAIAGTGVFCCFILAPIVLAMAFMFFFHLGGGDNQIRYAGMAEWNTHSTQNAPAYAMRVRIPLPVP